MQPEIRQTPTRNNENEVFSNGFSAMACTQGAQKIVQIWMILLAGVLIRNIIIRFNFVYYSSSPDLAPRQFSLPVWHCVSRANAFGENHAAGKFCESTDEQFGLLHLAKHI